MFSGPKLRVFGHFLFGFREFKEFSAFGVHFPSFVILGSLGFRELRDRSRKLAHLGVVRNGIRILPESAK